MTDIAEYYDVDEIFPTYKTALQAADNEPDRVWFIRHGDGSSSDDVEDDELWDVELYKGQLVNCAGFFVSTEPCWPEHWDTIFTY